MGFLIGFFGNWLANTFNMKYKEPFRNNRDNSVLTQLSSKGLIIDQTLRNLHQFTSLSLEILSPGSSGLTTEQENEQFLTTLRILKFKEIYPGLMLPSLLIKLESMTMVIYLIALMIYLIIEVVNTVDL